ncbi:hypothetical protein [Terriglobus sp.]|uniref:hypothetical protein n=1 Tax=Terriglobus sp. TaxID=1889013 RepID=UPI003B00253F
MNDQARIAACCEDLLSLSDQAEQPERGAWVAAARAFNAHRKVEKRYLQRALKALEPRLDAVSAEGNYFAAETASELMIALHRKCGSGDQVNRVLTTFGHTVLRGTRSASASVAIHWLQQAAEWLEKAELHTEAEALRLEVEKRAPEVLSSMASFQTEVQIPAGELEQELNRIIDNPQPVVALIRLVHAMIPKRANLEDGARAVAQASPYLNLIPQSIIGNDGLQRAFVGSIEEDLEGRTMVHSVHSLTLNAEFFWMGYTKIKMRFPEFTVSDMSEFCKLSELVTPDMHAAIEDALSAFDLAQHKAAFQAFISQLEPLLRGLLKLLGIPQYKGVRRHKALTEAKNINDVLGDSRVQATLDDSLHFFLRAVYTDKRAFNLRHEYAHRVYGHRTTTK